MDVKRTKDKITVEVDDLDIYVAEELKTNLDVIYKKSPVKASIDLAKVARVSTPALQVLISARKSFDNLELLNLSKDVAGDFRKVGIVF